MAAAIAGPEPNTPSRQWALIIAIKNHEEQGFFLPYALDDARWLKYALTECGVPEGQILMMTDDSTEANRPRLANLRRELKRFLLSKEIGPNDRMLVFFSGHGLWHGTETYLRSSDTRGIEPWRTALPVSEVRDAMRDCPASFKLLALDCCHAAGGSTSLDATTVAPECVVLASCKPDQESWEWAFEERGIFTYWLCRALAGEADTDLDGQLSLDEVFLYTQEHTKNTALAVMGKYQEPVCHGAPRGLEGRAVPLPRRRRGPS